MTNQKNSKGSVADSIIWRQKNPERAKEITKRYLEKNKELISLRYRRNWLFAKKGRGIDVSQEISEVELKISQILKERELKNY